MTILSAASARGWVDGGGFALLNQGALECRRNDLWIIFFGLIAGCCTGSRLLGRLTSVDYLGSSALVPLGEAVGGWATERLGSSAVFIIGRKFLTLLVALGLLHPDIRSMD